MRAMMSVVVDACIDAVVGRACIVVDVRVVCNTENVNNACNATGNVTPTTCRWLLCWIYTQAIFLEHLFCHCRILHCLAVDFIVDVVVVVVVVIVIVVVVPMPIACVSSTVGAPSASLLLGQIHLCLVLCSPVCVFVILCIFVAVAVFFAL